MIPEQMTRQDQMGVTLVRTYTFGPFRLEPAERRLTRDGQLVSLQPKQFDMLLVLLANAGRLVHKEEILQAVWGGAVVEEGNLAHHVSVLRKALGAGPSGGSSIETVPTRGYRLAAVVSVEQAPESTATGHHPDVPLIDQEIRITRTVDGTRIAYSVAGEGPPLVKAANWLNHLEYDWRSPVWRHLMREMISRHTFIRYDERGNGLSDWPVEDISFEAFIRDLEAVVDASGVDRFALLGISQGCAVSIAYAVRHPERVTRLVLHGGYATGWKVRERRDAGGVNSGRLELDAIQMGWGRDIPAYHQLFASIYIPGATPAQSRSWAELQRVCATPQNAARLLEAFGDIDVGDLLSQLQVPVLVLHSKQDAAVPFEAGRDLAARIPDARFVPLDSVNHLILEDEPAWPVFRNAVRRFLEADQPSARPATARTGPARGT